MTEEAAKLLKEWDDQITADFIEGPRAKALRAYQMLYRTGIRLDDCTDHKIQTAIKELLAP